MSKHNHHTNGRRSQCGPRLCAGCEASIDTTPAARIEGLGRVGWVCAQCFQRATDSTVFRDLVNAAIAAGATVPEMRRLFARAGLADIPTSPEQLDRACGMPLGTTRAAVQSVEFPGTEAGSGRAR